MGGMSLEFLKILSLAVDQLTKHVGMKVLDNRKFFVGMTSR